jgi:hypothetical protein
MPARSGTVPIGEAAQQAGVDIAQIQRWADLGGLEIQGRGGRAFVQLEQVLALQAAAKRRDPSHRRDSLRARLADARTRDPHHR